MVRFPQFFSSLFGDNAKSSEICPFDARIGFYGFFTINIIGIWKGIRPFRELLTPSFSLW